VEAARFVPKIEAIEPTTKAGAFSTLALPAAKLAAFTTPPGEIVVDVLGPGISGREAHRQVQGEVVAISRKGGSTRIN
jgi:hypothetical protein